MADESPSGAGIRLRLDDFDYELPESSIAQAAAEPRDSSRLLVMRRSDQAPACPPGAAADPTPVLEHRYFRDLPGYLRAGDCIVINDTKVMPSRIYGTRVHGGGRVEALLLKEVSPSSWEALMRPGRRLRTGTEVEFGGHVCVVAAELPDGRRVIDFQGDAREIMQRIGELPLPPYIRQEADGAPGAGILRPQPRDAERLHSAAGEPHRYQTVYAREEASSAAPTAGLHFTPELMTQLEEMGVTFARLTLEIGWETFRPVRVDFVDEHRVHTERYVVGDDAAATINQAKERGGRIIAVGTTSTRTVETVADAGGRVAAGVGDTSLFISPGHEFKVVDGMITNFHLPRTSLLMLVSAFAVRERVLAAYQEAVNEGYRFYSFGDAMLII